MSSEEPSLAASSAGPGHQPRVIGVLVTFRRPKDLAVMLDELAGQSRPLDHLIVVDNDPTEHAQDLVDAYTADGRTAEWLPMPGNLGPAGGISAGFQRALEDAGDEDWLLVLDDDDPPRTTTELEVLAIAAATLRAEHEFVGCVGRAGSRFDPRRGAMVRLADHELSGFVEVAVIGGGQMPHYRVAAVRAAGPYEASLFWGLDDLEYDLRVAAAGYSLWVDGDLQRVGRIAGNRMDLAPPSRTIVPQMAYWRHYYVVRNRIWILGRNRLHRAAFVFVVGQCLRLVLLALMLRPVALLSIQGRAIFDGVAGRLGRRVDPSAGK